MQDTKTYRRIDRSRSKGARQESLRRRAVRELKYGGAR